MIAMNIIVSLGSIIELEYKPLLLLTISSTELLYNFCGP